MESSRNMFRPGTHWRSRADLQAASHLHLVSWSTFRIATDFEKIGGMPILSNPFLLRKVISKNVRKFSSTYHEVGLVFDEFRCKFPRTVHFFPTINGTFLSMMIFRCFLKTVGYVMLALRLKAPPGGLWSPRVFLRSSGQPWGEKVPLAIMGMKIGWNMVRSWFFQLDQLVGFGAFGARRFRIRTLRWFWYLFKKQY